MQCIVAVILLDDMTVTALLTGRNAMKIMWNRENVTALQWTLLTGSLLSLARTRPTGGRSTRSTLVRRRWQNDLTKLPGVIDPARIVTALFGTWNRLTAVEAYNTILRHTNLYILIFQPNLSCENDAKLTDKFEIRAFFTFMVPCIINRKSE
jgi:hypothetical protein